MLRKGKQVLFYKLYLVANKLYYIIFGIKQKIKLFPVYAYCTYKKQSEDYLEVYDMY